MPTNAGIAAGSVPGWNSDFTQFTPYYQPIPSRPQSISGSSGGNPGVTTISSSSSTGVPYTVGGGVVPNAPALEAQSSMDIGQLLNPGYNFPDVNRQSAELAAGRGVPGSAAAYGTGLRMTDEERLKRIALGENLLSGAYARNQPNVITPYQQSQIDIQRGYLDLARQRGQISQSEYDNQLRRLNQPNITYSGTPGVGASSPAQTGGFTGYPAVGATSGTMPYDNSSPYILPNPGMTYPNPSAPMLPLYPGGPVGDGGEFDWNSALDELGLGDNTDFGSGEGDFGLGDFSGGGDYGGYA